MSADPDPVTGITGGSGAQIYTDGLYTHQGSALSGVSMGNWKPAVVALIAAQVAGCAGMSEQECVALDWRAAGFEDGAAGRAERAIGNYRNSCGQYGIAPDLDLYRQGHSEGVETYCRPARGFEAGRRGARYLGVCPAGVENEFLMAFNEGRGLFELESALRSIDNQIAAHRRSLETLEKDANSATADIIADGTSAERRAELLLETRTLADEKGRIESELTDLEIERSFALDELSAYRSSLAYAY